MSIYEGMLPKEYKKGKLGFYPVTNAQEWDDLPALYKEMDWYPQDVYDEFLRKNVRSIPEYVEFDVIYMEPYGINATVRVHVSDVQKILMCSFPKTQCHLYSIKSVVFQNGEVWGAKWQMDATTGAFAIFACGHCIARQGGYFGYIPKQIERTEDGWKWTGYKETPERCHYELLNPFTGK